MQLILIWEGLYINTITTSSFNVDNERLYMWGDINTKTPSQLKEILDDNPNIKTIVPVQIDGSVDTERGAIMAGNLVRKRGLNTHITSSSVISSGGVDFFLAGVKRTMERGAEINIHSSSDGFIDFVDLPKNDPSHDFNKNYVKEMLGTEDFYWVTLKAAPSDGFHTMTEAEILLYKIITEPILPSEQSEFLFSLKTSYWFHDLSMSEQSEFLFYLIAGTWISSEKMGSYELILHKDGKAESKGHSKKTYQKWKIITDAQIVFTFRKNGILEQETYTIEEVGDEKLYFKDSNGNDIFYKKKKDS